jgi:hypothetical protein
MKSRTDRQNNIVIFNVDEKTEENDLNLLKEIFQEIEEPFSNDNVTKIIRIGDKKITEDNNKSRPILVSLTEGNKIKLMKNLFKLRKSSNDKFKKIWIQHDMTKEEREINKKLREEAKEKNQKDSKNLYIVRGFPWERKIITLMNVKNQDIPEDITIKSGPALPFRHPRRSPRALSIGAQN